MDDDEAATFQKAADFGVRMIPLMVKLRQARDQGEGMTLDPGEVKTMIEIINLLRSPA